VKRKTKNTLIVIASIVFLGAIFGTIDYNRVKNNKMPLFMISLRDRQDPVNYIGLGYRMQRFTGLSHKQPLSHDNWVKFGPWFYISEVNIKLAEGDWCNPAVIGYFTGQIMETSSDTNGENQKGNIIVRVPTVTTIETDGDIRVYHNSNLKFKVGDMVRVEHDNLNEPIIPETFGYCIEIIK
jgi:hypothetical protein